MKCFYHNDLDGKCSAALVYNEMKNKFSREVELCPVNYGEAFPWGSIGDGEDVWMVDFSLQPFSDMIKLSNVAKLTWIDHHKTAIEAYTQSKTTIRGIQRNGIGACQLVFDYIHPNIAVPDAVRLLAEYDVWNHKDPRCLPFQYGMRLRDLSPEDNRWAIIFAAPADSAAITDTVATGDTILNFIKQDNRVRAGAACFDLNFEGLHFLAANQGPCNSQLFDSLIKPEHDAVLAFYWARDKWRVSMYTSKEGVDVSPIAKKYGGGGHAGAAGFQCTELPFPLTPKVV